MLIEKLTLRSATATFLGLAVTTLLIALGALSNTHAQESTSDVTVTKEVRVGESGNFTNEVTANLGEEVQYRVVINNTSEENVTNIRVKDTLPSGLTYIDNSLTRDNERVNEDDGLFGLGLLFDDTEGNARRTLTYKARIANNQGICGNRLQNEAVATIGSENTVKDGAVVKVVCRAGADLPNAGPGNVAAIFLLTVIGATATHYALSKRAS